MSDIASTPKPPYYAVIFTSKRTDNKDEAGYAKVLGRMLELAGEQPGFIGIEAASDTSGLGITVSYWDSLETIRAWQQQAEHREAQEEGRAKWYNGFYLRVCLVERAYDFQK